MFVSQCFFVEGGAGYDAICHVDPSESTAQGSEAAPGGAAARYACCRQIEVIYAFLQLKTCYMWGFSPLSFVALDN